MILVMFLEQLEAGPAGKAEGKLTSVRCLVWSDMLLVFGTKFRVLNASPEQTPMLPEVCLS